MGSVKSNTKKTNKQCKNYKVVNEYLFCKIANAGLILDYLHSVRRFKDGTTAFYFDCNDEIKAIIDDFKENGLFD